MTKKNQKSETNFESLLGELNDIIADMEKGNLPLEESLQKFERGVKLIRDCQSVLKNAEQKVKILVEKDGGRLEDFEEKN